MQRKRLLLFTVLMIICLLSVNVYAATVSYNTTSRQYLGCLNNNLDSVQTAYCGLIQEGGQAGMQICNASGTVVYASVVYPLYPSNPNYTYIVIPAYSTRTFFVYSLNGNPACGIAVYGFN